MLRLKEVASQSETFSKRALEKQRVKQMIEWMAQAATTAQCFLLTGRLYWLLAIRRQSDRFPQVRGAKYRYSLPN